MKKLLLAVLLTVWAAGAMAAINAFVFDNAKDEARFKKLSEELRCLVCQNQNLEDSNAELAQDLRRELYGMIRKGQSDAQILDYMVARYGDFVLYRPPVKPETYLLWFGPALLFGVGAVVLFVLVRRRPGKKAEPELSAEEQQRLAGLLKNDEEQG